MSAAASRVSPSTAEFFRTTALETVQYVRASLGLALAIRDLHKVRLAECERQLSDLARRDCDAGVDAAYTTLTDQANDLRGTVALAIAMARQLSFAESGMTLATKRVCGDAFAAADAAGTNDGGQ